MKKCLKLPSFFEEVDDSEVEYLDGQGFSWSALFLLAAGVAACFICGPVGIVAGVVVGVIGFVMVLAS